MRFLEKPSAETIAQLETKNINAGLYVLGPAILDRIPTKENSSFEYDIFPPMIKDRLPFFSHVLSSAYWRDVGTPESYLAAHQDFLSGRIGHFFDPDDV